MNHLAPRQGSFAIIMLISFCLHLLIMLVSVERQQLNYRADKGEKIVEQLSKEALVAVNNQDRISLSVLANRYQVDNDVSRLTISDANQQVLVQTGIAQNATGQVIEQPIIQNNQKIGHVTVAMKALSSGEILAQQFWFILGSAILHIFLWLIYGYIARPTNSQIKEIAEKIQHRMVISRSDMTVTAAGDVLDTDTEPKPEQKNISASIQDYLQKNQQTLPKNQTQTPEADEQSTSHMEKLSAIENKYQQRNSLTAMNQNLEKDSQLILQIHFFDVFQLLDRVAPEVSMPYLHLCEQLLLRACAGLLDEKDSKMSSMVHGVKLDQTPHFDKSGAVIHLSGDSEKVVLASVLLSKLILILNQVVYEKHRELSRFALPMTIGIGLKQQFTDVKHLMNSHAKEDGILVLLPKTALKFLDHNVQYKHISQPMSVIEREVVRYDGLSQALMQELIEKRDDILTTTERNQID